MRKIAEEEVFLQEVEDDPAGYLRLGYLWSSVPYIALIRIADVYRYCGYSRNLLEVVEKLLQERDNAVLYSSATGNETEPQAWHRHMGFVEFGFIAGMNKGGIDEIFFRKTLQKPS